MSDLKEFTAEEMKGCPPFTSDYKWGNVKFLYATSGMNFYLIEDEDGSYNYGDSANPFMCNPEDRMRAICKHLFELMPEAKRIFVGHTGCAFVSAEVTHTSDGEIRRLLINQKLSVNPFLHTDRTEITREELGL